MVRQLTYRNGGSQERSLRHIKDGIEGIYYSHNKFKKGIHERLHLTVTYIYLPWFLLSISVVTILLDSAVQNDWNIVTVF